jgi:hypothetical protein
MIIRELFARLRSFLQKRKRDNEFDTELAAHLEFAIQDHLQRGHSPDEARRLALVSLGGVEQTKELHRENRGMPSLDAIVRDIRYAGRTLRRDAGLTTFAVLIAGLGVGAACTVFSVCNALLLRPLPFERPDRLVWVSNSSGVGFERRIEELIQPDRTSGEPR